jgi:hypothetical protein
MKRGELSMGKYKDTEIIFIVEESPEGGYEARSLQHSVFTKSRYLRRTQKRWCVMRYPAISKPGTGPALSDCTR